MTVTACLSSSSAHGPLLHQVRDAIPSCGISIRELRAHFPAAPPSQLDGVISVLSRTTYVKAGTRILPRRPLPSIEPEPGEKGTPQHRAAGLASAAKRWSDPVRRRSQQKRQQRLTDYGEAVAAARKELDLAPPGSLKATCLARKVLRLMERVKRAQQALGAVQGNKGKSVDD